ncbi:hypothetical protein ACWEQ4_01520 [Rhodococcus sp. NPDC003994]
MTLALRHDTAPEFIDDKMRWCKELAHSSLLPANYRNKPENLFFAMEYADALGIARIQALTSINVISGKPSINAETMAGRVRAAGHKLRITGNDQWAKAELIRHDDPDSTFAVEWNLERARTAGLLTGNPNWTKYPAAMLKARAITEIVRMAASEVMGGIVYSAEELGAIIDQDGNPVDDTEYRGRTARPAQVTQGDTAAEQPKRREQRRGGAEDVRDRLNAVPTEQQQQPAPSGDVEGQVEAFLTRIDAATDRDTLLAIFNEAASLPNAEAAKTVGDMARARANDLGVAKEPAGEQQQPQADAQPADIVDGEVVPDAA